MKGGKTMINLDEFSLQELLDIKEKVDILINQKKEQLFADNSDLHNVEKQEAQEKERAVAEETNYFRKILEENNTSFDDNEDYWENGKSR